MIVKNLSDMTKGWFIGDFEPSLYKTQDIEVGIKSYNAGDLESKHYHKIATEFTAIISGRVTFNDVEYTEGQIVVISPHEVVEFKCLENAVTVVVKSKSVMGDKYIVGDNND